MNKQKITITLEPEVIKKIKIRAIEENNSVSKIINDLVKQYLKSKGVL